MTGTQIIQKFNLQVDDDSELSDVEALDLANDVYNEVADDRPWEWLKKSFTGNTSATVPYIALPTDFKCVAPNVDNGSGAEIAVVFVGATFSKYVIISSADRRDFRDQGGFAYIDVPNARLVFTKQPTSVQAVEYDYICVHTALTTSTGPLFRSGFHKIIAFGMAAKFAPIEQTDKSTSYQKENKAAYDNLLSDLAVEDAQLKLASS